MDIVSSDKFAVDVTTLSSRVRIFFMLQLWRVDQARLLIVTIFWCLTLAGLFFEKVAWRFKEISLFANSDALIISMLAIFICFITLLIGIIYDKVFRLWEFRSKVAGSRDAFMQSHMNDKEIVMFEELYLPLFEAVNALDPKSELDHIIAQMRIWIRTQKVTGDEVE